jgi:uncharacterized membrane protein AbrB (regulator of aidB expression)
LVVSLTRSVCFMRSSKVIFVLSAILFAFASFECSESSAQSSPRFYRTAPTAWEYARSRCGSCDRSQLTQVAGSFPAFYAPQVPMGPMVAGVVPTMSAYYVPTVPVMGVYSAPVVPVGRLRRRAANVYPSAIHPVYWYAN